MEFALLSGRNPVSICSILKKAKQLGFQSDVAELIKSRLKSSMYSHTSARPLLPTVSQDQSGKKSKGRPYTLADKISTMKDQELIVNPESISENS